MIKFLEELINNRKFKLIAALLTGVSFIIGLTLSVADVADLIKADKDISGEWKIESVIEETSYRRYKGLQLGYTASFIQNGEEIEGQGEKCYENGKLMRPVDRTPISFKGKLKNNQLILEIKERGKLRTTIGTMILDLNVDYNSFRGNFSSTAASSKGTSTGYKVPQ